MTYTVKEIFYSLQGEGARTGRPAVFLRFAGCNLACRWCDTDFDGGKKYESAKDLARAVGMHWPGSGKPYVICTGGEPLLQLDSDLVDALDGFEIAVETNGTIKVAVDVDWVCVSPKAGADLIQRDGDELKLVFPQDGISPDQYERLDFLSFYLQPLDVDGQNNVVRAVEYCMEHPQWMLSLQTQKILEIK